MFTPFSIIGCSLELMKTGEQGIVTVCKTQNEVIRKKLIFLGIKTGTSIMVEQQFPTLIIKVDNISMNLDRETARCIYVRVVQN